MTSLELAATNFRPGDFAMATSADGRQLSEWSLQTKSLGFASHRFLAPQLQGSEREVIRGHLSAAHPVTLSGEELRELGIVPEASHFAFSYPIVTARELQVSAKDARVADIAFLVFGGYMYFDAAGALRDVRAVIPDEAGDLRFAAPQRWLPEWTEAAGLERWRPVTLPALRTLGVRYFVWLRPGEEVDGSVLCRHGGFAYIFHEPSEASALQAQLDVFFQLEDSRAFSGKACPSCGRSMEWSEDMQGAYAQGWTCEFASACGQSSSSQGAARWQCRPCQVDICRSC